MQLSFSSPLGEVFTTGDGFFYHDKPSPTPTPELSNYLLYGDTLYEGHSLCAGQYIISSDGRYKLLYGNDGKLVGYDMRGDFIFWIATSQNHDAGYRK